MSCKEVYDESVYDFIINEREAYRGIKPLDAVCTQNIGSYYQVKYVPKERVGELNNYNYPYLSIPFVYSLLDTGYKEESCIEQVLAQESLGLDGEDIIVGIIDTGIDLVDESFSFIGGGTKVGILWDQNEGNDILPSYAGYGSVYERQEINRRLQQEQTLPRDQSGHGSVLAGIIAATEGGIAPLAELAIVKLKDCKEYLKDYYKIPKETLAYQENDIMAGVQFLVDYADKENKPLIICLALGTNMGDHRGGSYLAGLLSTVMNSERNMVVCGAGNEALRRHHYKGNIPNVNGMEEIEIQVGNGVKGFHVACFSLIPQFFTMDIISTSGEVMESVPANLYGEKTYRFNLENTTVTQTVSVIITQDGQQLIYTSFFNPTPGIWKLRMRGIAITTGEYHLWLPMEEQLSGQVVFVRPNPDTTITEPGNTNAVLTTGGYDGVTGGIFIQSGRGYSASEQIKPELVAPAVDVVSPYRGYEQTGTSVAVAICVGAAALYMQWVVYRRENRQITGTVLKYGLMLGTKKEENYSYPNKEWGFGTLCLFDTLRI